MSETVPTDKLQQLEQRHVQLLEELDALNGRLEDTLNSFGKQASNQAETVEVAAEV